MLSREVGSMSRKLEDMRNATFALVICYLQTYHNENFCQLLLKNCFKLRVKAEENAKMVILKEEKGTHMHAYTCTVCLHKRKQVLRLPCTATFYERGVGGKGPV